jgi:hypothetical protein
MIYSLTNLELLVMDARPQRNMATEMTTRQATPPAPLPNLDRNVE